jgi:hypothetical protein
MEVGGQLHAPAALLPGHTASEPAWAFGENKNLFPLPEIKPKFLGHPACSLVAIPTELSRLHSFIIIIIIIIKAQCLQSIGAPLQSPVCRERAHCCCVASPVLRAPLPLP